MSPQVSVEVLHAAAVSVEVVEAAEVRVVEVDRPSAVRVVEAIHPGPQGPARAFYVHQQTTAATTWVINHNLGYHPVVELLDSGSQEIDGDVAHPSVNQTIVTLNPASAGVARLT